MQNQILTEKDMLVIDSKKMYVHFVEHFIFFPSKIINRNDCALANYQRLKNIKYLSAKTIFSKV